MNTIMPMFPATVRGQGGPLITGHLAGVVTDFLSPAEVSAAVASIYAHRDKWASGFYGEQFSIGEVWYQHRLNGQTLDEYLAHAETSRETVNGIVPGLHDRVLDVLRDLFAPDPVRLRPGWAGPGLIVFPSDEQVAQIGGGPHFDWDGLEPAELEDWNLPAYSFVCMLQKPTAGGGLQIWPVEYDRQRRDTLDKPAVDGVTSQVIDYQPGDLWMFHALVAHKIDPFEGDVDRISLTFHVCRRDGVWDVWF